MVARDLVPAQEGFQTRHEGRSAGRRHRARGPVDGQRLLAPVRKCVQRRKVRDMVAV